MNVWYVSYGSNILQSRFLHYIEGGYLHGKVYHKGCEDRSLPLESLPYKIKGFELVFSYQSQRWNGGIGFIQYKEDSHVLGRKYLISKEQFIQVMLQENGYHDYKEQEEFTKLLENIVNKKPKYGQAFPFLKSLYGELIYLGECENGFPKVTFSDTKRTEYLKPSVAYLGTISKGLLEIGHFKSLEECSIYFEKTKGCKSKDKILQELDEFFNKN